MGKHRRKDGGGHHSKSRDEEQDDMSVASDVLSDCKTRSVVDDSPPSVDGESGDESENRVASDFVDTVDKLSSEVKSSREQGLTIMQKILQMQFPRLNDVLAKHCETLTDALLGLLKHGKNGEISIAANCLSVLSILVANMDEDADKYYTRLKPHLRAIMLDPSAAPNLRAAVANTLCTACYACCGDKIELEQLAASMGEVFSGALKGDGTQRQVTSPVISLYVTTLTAWSVLLSRCAFSSMGNVSLQLLGHLLESQEVDMRIAAGEALALFYEAQRSYVDKDLHHKLVSQLNGLANDGQKSRAKKDLRIQRSSFREIAGFIDGSANLETESIFLDARDQLELSTWRDRLLYRFFTTVLGTGIKHHLQGNIFLREDIFGMDPYVPLMAGTQRGSKEEVKRVRRAADHSRTNAKQKRRREKDDRRVDILSD